MNLSKTAINLSELSNEQKWKLVCSGIKDDGAHGEVALLLGTKPEAAIKRALAAAKLYRDGRVKYIVPSGGVKWEHEGGAVSEAELMAKILLENGVPADAIILENEATTTRENMIYGTLQINRKTKFVGIDSIILITDIGHMKRSLALARAFLPRKVQISAYPSYAIEDKNEWLKSAENIARLDKEIGLLKRLVDNGIIEDMEMDL